MMALETRLGYHFKDKALLAQALTHPSVAAGSGAPSGNYERLEFLGDAVLGLMVTEYLYARYGTEKEGALAKRRAALVRGETLAAIAREIGLGDYIYLSEGERLSGGAENSNTLENALEALIGSVYLDGGFQAVKSCFMGFWERVAESAALPPRDPKTRLQEWAQSLGKLLPEYQVAEAKGPSHAPVFTIEVHVDGEGAARFSGTSKRMAERGAAAKMLEILEGKYGKF